LQGDVAVVTFGFVVGGRCANGRKEGKRRFHGVSPGKEAHIVEGLDD